MLTTGYKSTDGSGKSERGYRYAQAEKRNM